MTLAAKAKKAVGAYERRRRARRPVDEAWQGALPGEVRYWERSLKHYKELARRFDPDAPLQPEFASLVTAPPGSLVRILDVGAGPLTCVGKRLDGYRVEINAVDALGDAYGEVLDRAGLAAPVRTRQCETERLTDLFERNTFDIAVARNTLDHSYDPIRAMRQMLEVVKPGCCIVLEHAQNEGDEEGYAGLHQWNLSVEDDRFFVWRRGVRIDVANALADVAEVVDMTRETINRVVLRKTAA